MSPVHRPPREVDFSRFPASAPIVIDNGASTFRIGWAGEAEPRVAFRNIVQRPRHRSSGETVTVVVDTDPALMKYFDCTRASIRSPFDDDVVYQFEYREYILDYGFDLLGATSEDKTTSKETEKRKNARALPVGKKSKVEVSMAATSPRTPTKHHTQPTTPTISPMTRQRAAAIAQAYCTSQLIHKEQNCCC